jgi:hypothetical protein
LFSNHRFICFLAGNLKVAVIYWGTKLVFLLQHQSDANPATHTIQIICVAELASHDAATATQVIYKLQVLLRE